MSISQEETRTLSLSRAKRPKLTTSIQQHLTKEARNLPNINLIVNEAAPGLLGQSEIHQPSSSAKGPERSVLQAEVSAARNSIIRTATFTHLVCQHLARSP